MSPYIKPEARNIEARDVGGLTYLLVWLCDDYLARREKVDFQGIAETIAALECAKLELYRRIAAPYEDRKRKENGDAFTVTP